MELTIEQALQKEIEAHKLGDFDDAEKLYRAILLAQPQHPHANHNLGFLFVTLGHLEPALLLLRTALDANMKEEQFWVSYFTVLMDNKKIEIARDVLNRGEKTGLSGELVDALEKNPGF